MAIKKFIGSVNPKNSSIRNYYRRLISDYCEICDVKGCNIYENLIYLSCFDFSLDENINRILEIYRNPFIIKAYENDVLIFEYNFMKNAMTNYFGQVEEKILANTSAELIAGSVNALKIPWKEDIPPDEWKDRLAKHGVYFCDH